MNYDWMKYDDIKRAKYPNLLAEIKESHHSICTVAEFMGLGKHTKEDDKTVWDKLTGRSDIYANECAGLMKLFGVKYEYLFSDELSVINDASEAYWRWYEMNKKENEEHEKNMTIAKIYYELTEDTEFYEFSKFCMNMTKEQRHEMLCAMKADMKEVV